MREIKFRAWDHHRKDMMSDGDFFINANGTIFQPYEYVGDGDDVPMNHLILMQYTGLSDKNGVKMFEGDLIELDGYGRGKVIFDEAMFQYKPLGNAWQIEPGVNCYAFYPTVDAKVEVIGNIYEHPELLK